MKKLITIVDEYKAQGHIVFYERRNDGGIRITRIDGLKFSGTKGNSFLRYITGNQLSQSQIEQRKKPAEERKGLTKKMYSEFKKVQRLWKENKQSGEIRRSTLDYHINKGDAEEYLETTKRYAMKLAQHALIYGEAESMERDADKIEWIYQVPEQAEKLRQLAEKLRSLDGRISDEDVREMHEIRYSSQYGNTEAELKQMNVEIEAILNKY